MKRFFVVLAACAALLLPAVSSHAATVDLSNGGMNFGPGDSLALSVGLANSGSAATVDAYLILLLPDGTPIFFEFGATGLVPHVATSDPATWKKFLSGVPLPSVLNTGLIPVFNYTFAGVEPSGMYQTLFALTDPGTFSLLDIQAKPFFVATYPIQSLFGTYSGNWTNQTFGSGGSAFAQMAESAPGALALTVTLGGNVFGNPSPSPFNVTVNLNSQAGITLSGGSSAFGTVNGTIAPNGSLSGTITGVPGGFIQSVSFVGTIAGGVLNSNYTVNFASGPPAVGTLTATRQ